MITPQVQMLASSSPIITSFTTMSAFSFEAVALAGGGYPAVALAYIAVTLLSCIGAAWLGMVAGRVL